MWRIIRADDGSIFQQYQNRKSAVADLVDYLRDGLETGEKVVIRESKVYVSGEHCYTLERVQIRK